jgi:hypothetical protein
MILQYDTVGQKMILPSILILKTLVFSIIVHALSMIVALLITSVLFPTSKIM